MKKRVLLFLESQGFFLLACLPVGIIVAHLWGTEWMISYYISYSNHPERAFVLTFMSIFFATYAGSLLAHLVLSHLLRRYLIKKGYL